MILTRVIPILLIRGESGLYKGKQFGNHRYVGDLYNAIKIFNEKQVDEISIVDITATKEGRSIDVNLIEKISSECFMPLSVGGGIKNLAEIELLIKSGAEKVILNTFAFENNLINKAAEKFGSQAVIVGIDYKKNWLGKNIVYTHSGLKASGRSPKEAAILAEKSGAGEILLTSIDNEGLLKGYDTEKLIEVSSAVNIPVIANGGASDKSSLIEGVKSGAHALGVGSMVLFHGPRQAVLISYPDELDFLNDL
jgi:cyclase